MLSKLYSRGIYRPVSNQALVSRNSVKAAVWTQVAVNIQGKKLRSKAKVMKTDSFELLYFETKLARRKAKLTAENVP